MDLKRTLVILALISIVLVPLSIGQESELLPTWNPLNLPPDNVTKTVGSGHEILVRQNITSDDDRYYLRIYLTALDWDDVDGDGVAGNDNLNNLADSWVSGMNETYWGPGLGGDNYLIFFMLDQSVKLYDLDVDGRDRSRMTIINGEKVLIHGCNETIEYMGYNISYYTLS